MNSKSKVISMVSLAVVLFELGDKLRKWGKTALGDGELDASEAAQLQAPIESALNDAVELPAGHKIVVTISVAKLG
jgi:hypothetical protein